MQGTERGAWDRGQGTGERRPGKGVWGTGTGGRGEHAEKYSAVGGACGAQTLLTTHPQPDKTRHHTKERARRPTEHRAAHKARNALQPCVVTSKTSVQKQPSHDQLPRTKPPHTVLKSKPVKQAPPPAPPPHPHPRARKKAHRTYEGGVHD